MWATCLGDVWPVPRVTQARTRSRSPPTLEEGVVTLLLSSAWQTRVLLLH